MKKKTKEERLSEILDLRRKLKLLGYNHSHDEVKRLFQVLSLFVENGEYIKDKFIIQGYNKIIFVELLPRQNATNVVRIHDDINV